MATDSPVPTLKKISASPIRALPFTRKNLAADEKLVGKVMEQVKSKFAQYKGDRKGLEELWDSFDYMLKCGQNETQRETERARLDRNSDDYMTRTKTENVGSAILSKSVRILAGFLVDILNSKPDFCRFDSRYNPEVQNSGEQADELAAQRQALVRWTRDAEQFDRKSVQLATTLYTQGNVPFYVSWLKRRAKVAIREESQASLVQRAMAAMTGGEAKKKSRIVEKEVLLDNRPDSGVIPNEDFWADNSIPNIQRQTCMFTRSLAGWGELFAAQREGELLNVETLTEGDFYQGDTTGTEQTRQDNAAQDTKSDDTHTGRFMLWQVFIECPIDESKPEGEKRWNVQEHTPARYRMLIASKDAPDQGKCLKLWRNDDPDDEWPIEMISVFSFDPRRLYKIAPAQLIRGNYTALTTCKMQALDASTLDNNRPLKLKAGNVHAYRGGAEVTDWTFGPDTVYLCENPASDIMEFEKPGQRDTIPMISYLEGETGDLLGIQRIMAGEPMGQRTSSFEAETAKTAAHRPHMMDVRNILHPLVSFYARKVIRYFEVFAEDDQIVKIADAERIYDINPAGLHGDFDVKVTIVDDYFHTIMEMDKWSYASRNVLPMFADVLDLRKLALYVCDRTLNMDVSTMLKPDRSDEAARFARAMIDGLKQGQETPIPPSVDLAVLLRELQGERVLYKGVEERFPWIPLLDRAIEQVNFMRENQPRMLPMGTSSAPGPIQNPGAQSGNMIAAERGARLGGIATGG